MTYDLQIFSLSLSQLSYDGLSSWLSFRVFIFAIIPYADIWTTEHFAKAYYVNYATIDPSRHQVCPTNDAEISVQFFDNKPNQSEPHRTMGSFYNAAIVYGCGLSEKGVLKMAKHVDDKTASSENPTTYAKHEPIDTYGVEEQFGCDHTFAAYECTATYMAENSDCPQIFIGDAFTRNDRTLVQTGSATMDAIITNYKAMLPFDEMLAYIKEKTSLEFVAEDFENPTPAIHFVIIKL